MRFVCAVMWIALCMARPARADTPPWVAGVSAAQKETAQKALDEGNSLFVERKYAEAMARYNAAIAAWDHPAIRFNIVRCLIQLERPVEAADQLKLALKYGEAPFDEQIYSEALAFQKLLANQISEIEVTCEQPGVQVTLDGQSLIACPGKQSRRLLPGEHEIVGTKQGFIPRTMQLVSHGGKVISAKVRLDPISSAARVEHRWAAWMPWVVFGGGFALAGLGELAHVKAVDDNAQYAKLVAGCTSPCASSSLDHTLESNATLENRVAIGLYGAGIAAITTGVVLLYLNRGRTVYDSTVEVTSSHGGAAISIRGQF